MVDPAPEYPVTAEVTMVSGEVVSEDLCHSWSKKPRKTASSFPKMMSLVMRLMTVLFTSNLQLVSSHCMAHLEAPTGSIIRIHIEIRH